MNCDGKLASERAGPARLAVPSDAKNANPCHAGAVFEGAEALGDATVRRIYGDFANGRPGCWNAAIREHSTVPCHQSAHVRGKNAVDIALAVDAMDLMYSHGLDGIALMSSDGDLTRLVRRLREGGYAVCGFGESKAPRAFRAACHCFETPGETRNRAREPGQIFLRELDQ